MTTRVAPSPWPQAAGSGGDGGEIPPLHNGDRLTQPEFHRRYEAMPPGVKAELIGGIVYMASPVGRAHGDCDISLGTLLGSYQVATPGVRASHNATVILSPDSEPQPDLHLRLLPEFGGRTRANASGILVGPPELAIEIAYSSEAIDLHAKRRDYEEAGILEYLVLLIREESLRAFDLRADTELVVDADGIYRSMTFPGLWIDAAAVVTGDLGKALRVLNKGLKSPAHSGFVRRLKAAAARARAAGKGTAANARKRKGRQ